MNIIDKLIAYAQNNLNVMLIGPHGVGKTTVVKEVIENRLKLNFKYYSSPTLDPWVDVVGVPKPDDKTDTLKFYKTQGMRDAEVLFFDELNRAHPRTLNAVLELVQFKSVNGEKFKNLKFVWCAINPPNDEYQVEELDPALVDRFHVYIKMPAYVDIEYLKTKMDEKIARCMSEWWNEDLNDDQRKIISPRRIEYIGTLVNCKVPWIDCIPSGHVIPHQSLDERLKAISGNKKVTKITKEFMLNNEQEVLDILKNDMATGIKLKELFLTLETNEFFKCRNILEEMPKEWILYIRSKKLPIWGLTLKKMFKQEKINTKKDYPKIHDVFEFEKDLL